MDELEERLAAAARQWRETQPPAPDIGPMVARLGRPAGTRARVPLGAFAAALVVVAVAVALGSQWLPAALPASPSPSVSESGVVPQGAIWLLTHADTSACGLALEQGYLDADPTSGLGVGNGVVTEAIAWPAGFTAGVRDDRLTLFDAAGQVRASEGDFVTFGGGMIGGSDAFGVCPADGPEGVRVVVPAAATSPSPSSSVTESEALSVAFRNSASTTPLRVLSVARTTFGAAMPTSAVAPADTPVWALTLSGTFPPASCGPAEATSHACAPPATSALVLVDATSGAWLSAETPAPVATATPAETPIGTPTETNSSVSLPNPGGTCSADQIEIGAPTFGPGFSTFGTSSVYVHLSLRNAGPDCVFHLPATIAVADATDPFEAVSVVDAGTTDKTGNNTPAMSAHIPAGSSLAVVLGAWWALDVNTEPTFPTFPCENAVADVTRVELPLAEGTLQIDLPTVLHRVCGSPASTSLSIELK